ncbi:MAG: hypothetical protein WCN81_00105 [Actinomycetes bacterium]
MQSSVPAFKLAFTARIAAVITGPHALAYWGNPLPKGLPKEAALVGPTKSRDLVWRGGMTQANETYEIEVVVSVLGPIQKSQEELLTRAYALNDLIISDVIGAWKALDYGGVVDIVLPGSATDAELIDDAGKDREARITQSYSVTAKI